MSDDIGKRLDELHGIHNRLGFNTDECWEMIFIARQQQAEIARLREGIGAILPPELPPHQPCAYATQHDIYDELRALLENK